AWRAREIARKMRIRSSRFIGKCWEQYLCWDRTCCNWRRSFSIGISVFFANKVIHSLPAADQGEAVAIHQDLGRQRTRVVVRRHRESVGAGAHQRNEIALVHRGQLAILREEIAALAYGTDHIHGLAGWRGR